MGGGRDRERWVTAGNRISAVARERETDETTRGIKAFPPLSKNTKERSELGIWGRNAGWGKKRKGRAIKVVHSGRTSRPLYFASFPRDNTTLARLSMVGVDSLID